MNSFIVPKKFGKIPHFHGIKRLPRKMKKRLKGIFDKLIFLTLEQKLWYVLSIENPLYRDFLVFELCKREGTERWF